VELIWKAKWTVGKVIFILARYFTLAVLGGVYKCKSHQIRVYEFGLLTVPHRPKFNNSDRSFHQRLLSEGDVLTVMVLQDCYHFFAVNSILSFVQSLLPYGA